MIRFTLVLVLMFLCTALCACQSVERALGSLDKPGARITGASLAGLSAEGVSINFEVEVSNPYSVDLPVVGLDYALASGGKSFLSGQAAPQGAIPARGLKSITLPATVRFRELLGALAGVKPGAVVPYRADINLSVDAPAAGRIALPLSREGRLPVPAIPDVALAGLTWDELSFDRAAATATLTLRNTNDFEASVSRVSYELSLAGLPVGSGMVKGARNLKPGETEAILIPLSFSPRSLGLAALEMLQGASPAYAIRGSTTLGTPFGDVDLPLSKSGSVKVK